MSDDLIITITDARRVFCSAGIRRWAAKNNIDFRSFVKNGISLEQLRMFNDDGLIDQVVKAKEDSNG